MPSKFRLICCSGFLLIAASPFAQQPASSARLTIAEKETLPKPSLWQQYSYDLRATGGIGPYHWRVVTGSLPAGMRLADFGEISGMPADAGATDFVASVTDNDNPANQAQMKFALSIEPPLSADWGRKAQVNSQRLDGSIKVSNRTGRDFDLTFIALAVNEIGRATAIGYQHFTLKKDTRDFDIPFGETLSGGIYTVNVDVVGEEPISNRIFRVRLVSGNEKVPDGP